LPMEAGDQQMGRGSCMGLTSPAVQLHFHYWFFVTSLAHATCHKDMPSKPGKISSAQLFVQPIIKSNKGSDLTVPCSSARLSTGESRVPRPHSECVSIRILATLSRELLLQQLADINKWLSRFSRDLMSLFIYFYKK